MHYRNLYLFALFTISLCLLCLLVLLSLVLHRYLSHYKIQSIFLCQCLILLFLGQGLLVVFFLVSGSSSIVRPIFFVVVVGIILASTGFELVPPVDLLRLDVIGVRGKKALVHFTGTREC